MKMAEKNFYVPGCLRSIDHAGTNAIGLCLVDKKAIQLTGAEHFKVHHHPWTCSSAPIFNGQQLVAILAAAVLGASISFARYNLPLPKSTIFMGDSGC